MSSVRASRGVSTTVMGGAKLGGAVHARCWSVSRGAQTCEARAARCTRVSATSTRGFAFPPFRSDGPGASTAALKRARALSWNETAFQRVPAPIYHLGVHGAQLGHTAWSWQAKSRGKVDQPHRQRRPTKPLQLCQRSAKHSASRRRPSLPAIANAVASSSPCGHNGKRRQLEARKRPELRHGPWPGRSQPWHARRDNSRGAGREPAVPRRRLPR